MAYAAKNVLSGYRPYSAYGGGGSAGYNPYSMYGRGGGGVIGGDKGKIVGKVPPTKPQIVTDPWDAMATWDPATSGYSWWPSNAEKISDVWKASGDPAAGNVKQNWWRSPDWPMGGGLEAAAYNPYYGWQDIAAVKDLYRKAEGPVTWDQFSQWPLEKRVGSNYDQWLQEQAGGTGGTEGTEGFGGYFGDEGTGTGGQGDQNLPENMLETFGYTGDIPINPMEQTYLDAIQQLYMRQPTGLQTIQPANQFYNDVLGGAVGATGEPFRQNVYQATQAGAMQNYDTARRNLATKFSERGGYFGGGHSIAQAKLAGETSNSLNQILAGLNLEGFNQDVLARQGAASGLAGLGTTQQGISSQILQDIYGGGNLLTQRDLLNRQQSQEAQGRAYNDWLRAQQENQGVFGSAANLLGYQAYQPMAQQPQQSQWGAVLAALINAGGQAAMASASSKKWKKDIVSLSKEEEQKIFENLQKVPLFKYRYTHELDSVPLHVGLIAEEAPEEIKLFDGNMIGLYEYIAYLNAAFKVLTEKVKALEAREVSHE